jgi:uncharacterized damage-inducible protein DinB
MQIRIERSTQRFGAALVLCVLVPAVAAVAQDRPRNAFNQKAYGYLKDVLIRSAEKMPEENYGFKPVDSVRSFGQILGHVADSNYFFCSLAVGEKNPSPKIESTKTSKADLIAGLKGAFAYCDKAHAGMTDASASQMVKFQGEDMSKLDVLTVNNMHSIEHYGNLVSYMRMKNIVPPSSEPKPQPTEKK